MPASYNNHSMPGQKVEYEREGRNRDQKMREEVKTKADRTFQDLKSQQSSLSFGPSVHAQNHPV